MLYFKPSYQDILKLIKIKNLKMKKFVLIIINFLVLINSTKNENNLATSKSWESICKIQSCESTLEQCILSGCLGKTSCKTCVETYHTSCSRCVDDIYDETTQVTLPDSHKTIICDANNQLHTIVCNFYCRSLYKPDYKCEIISDIPVCNCIDMISSTTTTSTTTKKPNYPSKILENLVFFFRCFKGIQKKIFFYY